ncbi:M3 family metallopeptidase [Demequina globuliformis]|uniref:M3 family metallopeptidase n=1 Tax=Demequina globuliformis TaxID=676202 RepID=UPI000A060132|nr:M3 family metallopeptidase [Demequina globuliformis]
MTDIAPVVLPVHGSPDWEQFTADYVAQRLSLSTALLEQIRSDTTDDVLAAWNDADIAVDQAATLVETLTEVHPDPDVRSRATALLHEVDAFRSARDGDPALYHAIEKRLVATDDRTRHLRELVLRDFRLQGAHLDDDARRTVAQLSEQISAATTEFADNIREDVGSIRVPLSALADMPADYIEAHAPDAEGFVTITTDYPDLVPILDMCSDRAVREALMRADYERAPANDEVLARLLHLRHDKARALGFEGWPDYATAPMMMTDGAGIESFLSDVAAAALPAGKADADVILARLREDHPDAESVLVSDSRYYLETLKAERYGVDGRLLRQYFDYSRVRDGILALAGDLFELEFRPVAEAPRWHGDVEVYDVHARGHHVGGSRTGDDRVGRIHLDMHPREGKYGHMACFGVVGGIADRYLPESALVCNFPRGKMTFDDLETFLHEFGHLMHAILSGNGEYARLAGLSERGEWDFVEAPSQLLEDWAYSHDVLRRFAVNDEGEEIPENLVEGLRASRDFGEGLLTCRQLVYAQMSYRLHRDVPEDIEAAASAIEREFDVRTPLTGTHQYRSFGHLTTYSACYYTYQWSLAIAKDLATGFDRENLLDPERAHRYRDTVLAPGGSKPAADLIADFLGRPFSSEAYADWLASLSK